MKYEDIDNVENQIINNDYVSYDVNPRANRGNSLRKSKALSIRKARAVC